MTGRAAGGEKQLFKTDFVAVIECDRFAEHIQMGGPNAGSQVDGTGAKPADEIGEKIFTRFFPAQKIFAQGRAMVRPGRFLPDKHNRPIGVVRADGLMSIGSSSWPGSMSVMK